MQLVPILSCCVIIATTLDFTSSTGETDVLSANQTLKTNTDNATQEAEKAGSNKDTAARSFLSGKPANEEEEKMSLLKSYLAKSHVQNHNRGVVPVQVQPPVLSMQPPQLMGGFGGPQVTRPEPPVQGFSQGGLGKGVGSEQSNFPRRNMNDGSVQSSLDRPNIYNSAPRRGYNLGGPGSSSSWKDTTSRTGSSYGNSPLSSGRNRALGQGLVNGNTMIDGDDTCNVGGRILKVGDRWSEDGICGQFTCLEGAYRVSNVECPPLRFQEGSTCTVLEQDMTQHFPRCCPQLSCSSDNKNMETMTNDKPTSTYNFKF